MATNCGVAEIDTGGRHTAGYKPPAVEAEGMTDMVRCWLVEREHDQRNLVTVTYATQNGDRALRRQGSPETLQRRGGVTAAVEADPDDLESVEDDETRQRYATEVDRMRERHDPDDTV